MGATRTWPLPDLRNGTTLHLITDTHFGEYSSTSARLDKVYRDCELLADATNGYVLSGDLIDWLDPNGPEDDQYIAWRDSMKARGKPWLDIPGNHDLQGRAGAGKPWRHSYDWAEVMGYQSANNVVDIGDVRVIGFTPDVWKYSIDYLPCTIPPNLLIWIDEQLTAAGSRPCVLVTHAHPTEQYQASGNSVDPVGPQADLDDLVGSHSNVIGWLSGHRHFLPASRPDHAEIITMGGRQIFAVNGPSAGSIGATNPDPTFPSLSLFVTFMDGAVDVRYRDHRSFAWEAPNGSRVRTLTLA